MTPPEEYVEHLIRLLDAGDNELWHQDTQGMWHWLEWMIVGGAPYYFYEQSQKVHEILEDADHPYLESDDLADLIRQVQEHHQVEIYAIPIEQWHYSPDVKES